MSCDFRRLRNQISNLKPLSPTFSVIPISAICSHKHREGPQILPFGQLTALWLMLDPSASVPEVPSPRHRVVWTRLGRGLVAPASPLPLAPTPAIHAGSLVRAQPPPPKGSLACHHRTPPMSSLAGKGLRWGLSRETSPPGPVWGQG